MIDEEDEHYLSDASDSSTLRNPSLEDINEKNSEHHNTHDLEVEHYEGEMDVESEGEETDDELEYPKDGLNGDLDNKNKELNKKKSDEFILKRFYYHYAIVILTKLLICIILTFIAMNLIMMVVELHLLLA